MDYMDLSVHFFRKKAIKLNHSLTLSKTAVTP